MASNSNDVLKPLTQTQGFYNNRLKYYGDDFIKSSTFSKAIYNPHKLERHKKIYKSVDVIENSIDNCADYKELSIYDTDLYDYNQMDMQFLEYQKKNDKEERIRNDSIKRAQDKIYDIAYANDFDFFITYTLDKTKINRYEPKEIISKLNHWLSNMVQRKNLMYLIVPEYHKDGAVHFHGLIKGNLNYVDSGLKDNSGRVIYNCDNWSYGFSTAVKLNDRKGVCGYITKYITKDTKKIFGRYYLSGGKINRDVQTEYYNVNYNNAVGTEVFIPNANMSVKYETILIIDD